jgi:hypothetical protein
VAAAPAVAFAATDEDNENVNQPKTTTTTGQAKELRRDAKVKLEAALARAKHERKEARERRRERRLAEGPVAGSTAAPHLEAIAACESGGDPTAIGGGGAYRGKYQFDYATWASVGGSGDPAAAPEAEQDMRAAMLYERAGAAPWPVCGS